LEHDETTYENTFLIVLVATITGNHPVVLAGFSTVVDSRSWCSREQGSRQAPQCPRPVSPTLSALAGPTAFCGETVMNRPTPDDCGRALVPPRSVRSERLVELEWVGHGAWRACDVAVPSDDARCVIAYVECRAGCVDVTWVTPFRPMSRFDSLREAHRAIALSMR
jgi:hypothetical protein